MYLVERGMLMSLRFSVTAVIVGAALAMGGLASASAPTRLLGTVGPGFTISLKTTDTERLGWRQRTDPSEQIERFRIVLQHPQRGGGEQARALPAERGDNLLLQRVTDGPDALRSRDEHRAQVRRTLDKQRAKHATVADPNPTLLARNLLENVTLDCANLDGAAPLPGPALTA
jgi:hypothetical protein